MQPRVVPEARAHSMSCVVASLTGLHLLVMLGVGYLVVTTDWRTLECFDGTEPACREPAQDYGLSAVPAGYWLLTLVAVMATLGAFVLALRVRRIAHAVPVLVLCATSALIPHALWWASRS